MKGKSKPNPRLSARYLANRRANESNRRYYYRHKAEFLKEYKNKYIATSNNRLTDVDDDRASLLHRVFRTLGGRPFFYTQVTVQPRIVHIPLRTIASRTAFATSSKN
jgi:hypothetical protein